ncbi:helix-turn-helix transcriptional regulator [Fusobacterium polymorphum]|jgi:DNA-binding helix-turn-helix protein|uniref:helix-turn-helix transcriptional regulator n=1 Tax=Fusobacterium nucleatum subsp. polymorphum TaxID=76857 RepID=UPI002B4BA8D2|nr:helix-turn-helix transcriptional regulator [Fusobacterium polymorphum]WRL77630.1 helix-turn-helix transcriptional regulator [Fusobacterium polymorphum]
MKLDLKKLEIAMAEKCYTIQELSKVSTVGVSTISNIFNRGQQPNLWTIGKLARALKVSVKDLIIND